MLDYLTKHDLVHIMLSVWDRRDWMEEVVVWIYYCKTMNDYYVGKNLVEKSGGGGWGGGVVEAMRLFLRRELECHLIVLWQNNEAGERYCELLLL